MNSIIFNTLPHLKFAQIFHQIYYRTIHWNYHHYIANTNVYKLDYINWIAKLNCHINEAFCFLNKCHEFKNWSDTTNGNLWAYNLNYMDWLIQFDSTFEEGAKWIDCYIDNINDNKIGLDPYPTALRGINWIKFISSNYSCIEKGKLQKWNDSLYSQYKLLYKNLEFHLLGNHLLEDVFSLFIAALYFNDLSFYKRSTKILIRQLKEQILKDGAHFEQSPMYHCILLDRLLDCYNFSVHNHHFKEQLKLNDLLGDFAIKMLGHLESIIYSDGTIPLLNDAAYEIAPTPKEIFDYAKRLELNWSPISLSESGFRKFKNDRLEGIIDIADIKASYQPGHSHADTFNYELRVDGKPFIVDTGISTYEKNERRQYERSTRAHNTVSIDEKDSSEVWSGFRIGKRASVTIIEDNDSVIKASHNGFGKNRLHVREFNICDGLKVVDEISDNCAGISYIHFAPTVSILSFNNGTIITDKAHIEVEGATKIEMIDNTIATKYNILEPIKVAVIFFTKRMEYNIFK